MTAKALIIEQLSQEDFKSAVRDIIKGEIQELSKNFTPKEPTEFLTRAQVAELLHVDLSSIHNYCKSGKLKPYGLGSRVFFKRSEVEAAIIPLNSK